jgi:hypothetical protein
MFNGAGIMTPYTADIIQKIQSFKPILATKDLIRVRLFGSTVLPLRKSWTAPSILSWRMVFLKNFKIEY